MSAPASAAPDPKKSRFDRAVLYDCLGRPIALLVVTCIGICLVKGSSYLTREHWLGVVVAGLVLAVAWLGIYPAFDRMRRLSATSVFTVLFIAAVIATAAQLRAYQTNTVETNDTNLCSQGYEQARELDALEQSGRFAHNLTQRHMEAAKRQFPNPNGPDALNAAMSILLNDTNADRQKSVDSFLAQSPDLLRVSNELRDRLGENDMSFIEQTINVARDTPSWFMPNVVLGMAADYMRQKAHKLCPSMPDTSKVNRNNLERYTSQ